MMNKINKFLKETSGNVAMTTAITLFPIMTAAGAAFEYTNYINTRDSVQNSTDAAGIAAARQMENELNITEASLEAYAKKFFKANVSGHLTEADYDFDLKVVPGNQGIEPPIPDKLRITAKVEYKTMFGSMFFDDKISEDIISEISLGNRTVEIALVLDNSGSMGGSRIATLKTEAKSLVDTVFNSAALTTIVDPVKFSLVPFAGSVNIGTNNKNKKWMDRKGWSPVHHENFDWENSYRTSNNTRPRIFASNKIGFQERIDGKWKWKTRYDLFDMVGEDWAGCVEMRPWPYNTLDAAVEINQPFGKLQNSMDADGDGVKDGSSALFVPYFAPDEPDRKYADRNNWGGTSHYWDDDSYRNDYLYDFKDYNPSNGSSIQLHTDVSGNYMSDKDGSSRQIERTNAVFKYQVNDQYRGTLYNYRGPNYGCTTDPIVELSTDKTEVKNKIDEMDANGSTNIQQGLTWGWRTLSPGEPFTGGREKDDKRNIKFVVLLTDGNNWYQDDGDSTPNKSAYGAWGYARDDSSTANLKNALSGLSTHNRMAKGLSSSDLAGTIYTNTNFDLTPSSSSEFEKIMNAHTNQACNNIKNDGVSIFTVAFSVPQSGGVRDLLEACAGSGIKNGTPIDPTAQYYYDVDQGGLAEAFQNIARQIANLRISG